MQSGAHKQKLGGVVGIFACNSAKAAKNAVAKARKAKHLYVLRIFYAKGFSQKLFAFKRKLLRNYKKGTFVPILYSGIKRRAPRLFVSSDNKTKHISTSRRPETIITHNGKKIN